MLGFGPRRPKAILTEVQERALSMKRVTRRGLAIAGEEQKKADTIEIRRRNKIMLCGFLGALAVTGFALHRSGGDASYGVRFIADMNRTALRHIEQAFSGQKELRMAFTLFEHAMYLCTAAALLPAAVFLWIRMRDLAQGNRYVSFLGVTVGIPFTWFFVTDFFGPLALEVFGIFT